MQKVLTPEQINKALKAKRIRGVIGRIAANIGIYFMLVLMYAPLIFVVVYSFSGHDTLGVWGGFTFKNYVNIFTPSNVDAKELWSAVKNTLLVAGLSALISTVLGTLGAIGMFYIRKNWLRTSLEYVNQIPIVNAEIVTAISLCVLFVLTAKLFNMPRSLFTVVLGHVVLSLPYVVLSVKPKLEQMDPSVYEAAMDLGANQTQALFKVVIPDIIPGILSGFMLSVTLSLDDFVITAFTKPVIGGFDTISTWVDAKMARGRVPNVLKAFTAILFAVILIVMIVMNIKGNIDAKKNFKKENRKNEK